MSRFDEQLEKARTQSGFIAALDHSGGSTVKALSRYGIAEDSWSDEDEMLNIVHAMRTRIMSSPSFDGNRILGAILYEDTMERDVLGKGSAEYLWNVKNIVPFLKVDQGLAAEADGIQLMNPISELDALLTRARDHGIFGTKMRSVIKQANAESINAIVEQQFNVGGQIIAAGLVPIIEPEVDIHCPNKAEAETILHEALTKKLNGLSPGERIMLKLTLPEKDNLYADCVSHPNVVRVVALSGGYDRDDANNRLARQNGMIASFSRALVEGLTAQQPDTAFNEMLDDSISSILAASDT